MSSRRDLVRRYLLYKQAANLIHAALKAEGEVEHRENGAVATHRLGFAVAAGSMTQDHVEVTDRDAFMGYLLGRYPTEVVTRTVHEVRNPNWLEHLLDTWAVVGPEDEHGTLADTDGTVVPGVRWVPGGDFVTVGVTGSTTAKRRIRHAVERGISGGDWSAFRRIEEGEVDLARPEIGAPPAEAVQDLDVADDAG